MTTKYRINWKATKTSATGHGEPIFDYPETAQQAVDALDVKNRGILTHWVESVKVAEKIKEVIE